MFAWVHLNELDPQEVGLDNHTVNFNLRSKGEEPG